MRLGDRVTYVDTKGKEHGASVTGVPDTGPSGNKIIHLSYTDGSGMTVVVPDVVHGRDRVKGKAYWLLVTETDDPPDRRAELAQQPTALAKAEASGALPAATRRAEDTAAKPRRKTKVQ